LLKRGRRADSCPNFKDLGRGVGSKNHKQQTKTREERKREKI